MEASEERANLVIFEFLKDGAVTFAIKDKFRKFMNGSNTHYPNQFSNFDSKGI